MNDSILALLMILTTLFSSVVANAIKKKINKSWMHPLILATVIIISLLLIFNVSYEEYNTGAKYISYVLGPITVVLAVPLFKNRVYLKKYSRSIILGIASGSLIALVSVYAIASLFGLDKSLIYSLMGKSVTTPIGIVVADMLGVNPSITVLAIIVTGVFSISISSFLFKLFKINNHVARGVALGTTAHAIGTAKAMEKNPVEGAMSALSIGLAALFTVFWIVLYIFLF